MLQIDPWQPGGQERMRRMFTIKKPSSIQRNRKIKQQSRVQSPSLKKVKSSLLTEPFQKNYQFRLRDRLNLPEGVAPQQDRKSFKVMSVHDEVKVMRNKEKVQPLPLPQGVGCRKRHFRISLLNDSGGDTRLDSCRLQRRWTTLTWSSCSTTLITAAMEYMPETLLQVNKGFLSRRSFMPACLIKVYAFQLFRALACIHGKKVCHRDIKPHNFLVDSSTNLLKLCDFGSAKKLAPGKSNISYICSRCYRAPELIFSATDYSFAIDQWSAGCILAELVNGAPLFLGGNNLDQLLQIFKVLGSPSKAKVLRINPDLNQKKIVLPNLKAKNWKKVLRKTDPRLIDLISRLLVYAPSHRLTAKQALQHPFFDDFRSQSGFSTLKKQVALPKQLNSFG